jgi:hypothetical protein
MCKKLNQRENVYEGAFKVVLEKINSYEPKSCFHMNQHIDHIENFVQEVKTLYFL